MNTAYFYLTSEGEKLTKKLAAAHPGDIYGKDHFKENLTTAFSQYDFLVCVMAAGIVVRILAPLIVHKTSDPAVVVLDQKGRYAISLLSGHLGGANALAKEMAFLSGGEPVITTATDVAGELSFDTFAKEYNMAIENIGNLKYISSALLENKKIRILTDTSYLSLKDSSLTRNMKFFPIKKAESILHSSDFLPTVVIDEGFTFIEQPDFPVLYLRPRTICAGIGCKRNMEAEPIEEALLQTLKKEGLSPLSLKCISTIPLKAEEPGILTTAKNLQVPLKIIATEDIAKLDIAQLGISSSDFVAEQTGVLSVSTASSYLASGKGQILTDKAKFKGITIALSKEILPTSPDPM